MIIVFWCCSKCLAKQHAQLYSMYTQDKTESGERKNDKNDIASLPLLLLMMVWSVSIHE